MIDTTKWSRGWLYDVANEIIDLVKKTPTLVPSACELVDIMERKLNEEID